MNGLSKSSHMDLKDTKRMDIAWKSRILIPMPSPLWTKICRHEANDTSPSGESLEALLSNKSGQRAFREFLKSEFCEENLDFWLACQEFKSFANPKERTQRAASIYEEFIRDDSPKQVNLDFYTREIISQGFHQPSPLCFAVAQKKIYSLMENDSFPRFIQSVHYKVLTDAASKQKGLRKPRMALRLKSAGVDSLQNGLLLLQKD